MLLTNEFVVHRPLAQTWEVLTDLERIAPCMPGAQLTSVQGDEYHGKVKVKVGPMTAQFTGVATFKERDAEAHRAVIDARGRDATGKGRASALVTAVLAAEGDDTKVTVETDLTIAGPLAQMGRSTIGDISTRLLGQFVTNLEAQLAATAEAPPAPAAVVAAEPPAPPAATEASAAPVRTIDGPEAQPVDLLQTAGTTNLIKIAVPVVVLVAVIIALVVWLV